MRIRKFSFILILLILLPAYGGEIPPLMPVPREIKVLKGKFVINSEIQLKIEGPESFRVRAAAKRFKKKLADKSGIFFSLQPRGKPIRFVYNRSIRLSPVMDESYELKITREAVLLKANTDVGIVRGVATLLQLISNDERDYFFPAVYIKDSPRFPWRGLLIDVVRHFMPVEVLKRNIEAMAAVKLNVLHLHLSDDQGFRMECKTYSRLHRLASDGNYYTYEQMREIISYADERGIRVIPEFDVPGHTTSWLVAYPSLAAIQKAYLLERTFGVKDPVMDPTRKLVYKFLDRFFGEMAKLFPDPYFHIGGDEVNGKHWKASDRIQKFMKKHRIKDKHQLQAYFNKKIYRILKKHGKKLVGWDEILHPDMPTDVIIQSWRGKEFLRKAAKLGFKVILSNGYYIDLFQSAAEHYLNDPLLEGIDLSEEEKKRVLGGEATMWAELVTPENVDSRIWPRTAAIAERLWSPSRVKDVEDMYRRLERISLFLEEMGTCHIKNQEMMLRRLANYGDPEPLRVLADAVQPVKYYQRHRSRPYTVFSPLTRFVDAAIPDPLPSVKFRSTVKKYLETGDPELRKEIIWNLTRWERNHEGFLAAMASSPVLKEVETLSENLSFLARLALTRLKMEEKHTAPSEDWIKEAVEILKKAKEPVAELEIAIYEPLKKLILMGIDDSD